MTWPFIDRLDAAWPGESRQGSAVGLSARTALDAVIDGDQPRHISNQWPSSTNAASTVAAS
jgi:hypothetical protein